MTAAVQVRGLTKIYGQAGAAVHALRGVDLTVMQGQVFFITGPSGSGKTTLLSILGCVLRPSAGDVVILGTDIKHLPEHHLAPFRLSRLGFIFQGHNLIASLTAIQNVCLPMLLQGLSRQKATARAAADLASVGLSDKLHSKPGDLSGGQKQRVAIARALANRPALVLADEPTAALDAKSGYQVMQMLTHRAHQHGTTVVVVTHDNRTYEFAEKMVAMEDGCLEL